ncbi:MAG: hypothetical protein GF411_00125 [Candidatus Lokiarchaeota archaeon]|nr:hypothetical protein [Candidatus Lokiarchaeota archaeon]
MTHSLVMAGFWSVLVAVVSTIFLRFYNSQTVNQGSQDSEIQIVFSSLYVGLIVFSHWILDFIGWPMSVFNSAYDGVPLFLSDIPAVGLGVYSTWIGAIGMDFGVLILGILVYLYTRRQEKREL